jgi:hypothetical protein
VAAHESLQKSTHEKLPLDAPSWDEYLAKAKSSPDALAKKKGFKDMVLTGFSSKPSPAPPAGVPGKSGE